MSVSYQFGDVGAHGPTGHARGASPEAEQRTGVRNVLSAGDVCNGAGSVACRHRPRGPLELGPSARRRTPKSP